MSDSVTDRELELYLDEDLSLEDMAKIERALRDVADLRDRLASVHARRDGGSPSLAAIWRRHRLTCPSREQLGSYLLGTLEAEHAGFIRFHIEVSGCRACRANWLDLSQRQAEAPETV